jgi:hypothetical protein
MWLNTVLKFVPTNLAVPMMNARNQARDQRILDRRHTGRIAKKVSNSKHVGFS